MARPRIVRIEWAPLAGERYRHAGSNARRGEHGLVVRRPFARVTTDDAVSGFGPAIITRAQAESIVGSPLDDAFVDGVGAHGAGLGLDYALWDLAGQRAGRPVYQLLAATVGRSVDEPFRVPCYDTSLYFDDIHLTEDAAAADLIADEARDGYERGHRAFKIKVGRGARWMSVEEGTRRDIAVIRAVRVAVGPEPPIMIDANNGYTLNLAKRVLAETADCGIFWLEEAFHEDAELYGDLKRWLAEQGLTTLIADGEGQASPSLLDWARDGLIDVVQYDYFNPGFTRWLEIGRQIDGWGRRSAPHHYGGFAGNYVTGHLAGAIGGFTFVEWDEARVPGIEAPGYAVRDGRVEIPAAPGFGLTLDEDRFLRAVAADGFAVMDA